MTTDRELKQSLLARLETEPGVSRQNLEVFVQDGLVTLEGTVASYAEKVAAARAVQHLGGVTGFVNDVLVEIPSSHQRTDSEITAAATEAINCITTVPTETIKLAAKNGWLTLNGTLDNWQEKEAAENAVHHLAGIVGVTNDITILAGSETVPAAAGTTPHDSLRPA
jgi:osmotically-inducible protein OsmY